MPDESSSRDLAPAYQLALDLEAQGLRGAALAERLGVPTEALPSLLAVAHAKAETGQSGHRTGTPIEPEDSDAPDRHDA